MKSLAISFAAAALLAGAGAARADQCQLVDGNTALRAQKLLADHPMVVTYCEPCRDAAPSDAGTASWVKLERGPAGAYEVVIDRREVDLAYTYVQTGVDHFDNLALLAGCPASGVSASLTLHAPPPPPPEQPLTVRVEPPPAAVPAAPARYVITEEHPIDLLTLLLTCLATSTVCTLGLFLFLRRRRLAMRPRAVHLIDKTKP